MRGETLLVSAYDCDYFSITSVDVVKNFLIRAVKILNMTPVDDTLTVRLFPTEDGRGDYGISGFIILTESHLSFHGWTEKRFARIEFSSCRAEEGNLDKLVNIVKLIFGAERVESSRIEW